MLVVAGAGTGKTTVLTKRIARLVREGYAQPEQILALTYTKNAAQEMSERVRRELRGTDVAGLRVRTFHDYSNELLARHGTQFGVLDDKDLWIYLRKRIRELRLNYFVRAADVSKFLTDLLDFTRRCQDELVSPERSTRSMSSAWSAASCASPAWARRTIPWRKRKCWGDAARSRRFSPPSSACCGKKTWAASAT